MKVQLTLYAKNLPNVAGVFKGTSDPYAVVQKLGEGQTPVNVGKTEVVKNSLDPKWTKRFVIDHDLGRPTHLSIAVYDKITKGEDKSMGSAMFNVGNILGAKGNIKATRMKGGGIMYAKVQKYEEGGTLRLQLKAVKLQSTEGLGFGVLSKSDPFYELHRQTVDKKGWDVVYRSQPVKNNLNPIWSEADIDISTLCRNELNTPIKVKVWDWEKDGKHVDMGEFETSVSGLVAAKNFSSTMDINRADLASAFTLTKIGSRRDRGLIVVLRADLVGVDGAKPELTKPTKPREAPEPAAAPTTAPAPVAPSAPAYDPPPAAPPAYVPPPSAPAAFVPPAADEPPPFVPPPSAYNPSYAAAPAADAPPPFVPQNPVTIEPSSSPYAPFVPPPPQPTFVDYVSGGCELNLAVAVDFSASNGDPRKLGTLHYFNRGGVEKNDYEKAIAAVGGVLAEYDSDKKFPMWGFGAKFGGQIRHCFQCGRETEVDGIDGLLFSYRQMFKTGLAMSEPTVINDVIKTAAYRAKSALGTAQMKGSQAYTILLILTDGQLSDVNDAAKAIYEVTDTPLSIVIVGLGGGDFSGMRYLDKLKRDDRGIVKFVPFNDHMHNMQSLSAATLDEIPDQLVGYFLAHDIKPNPPVQQHDDDIAIDDIDSGMDYAFGGGGYDGGDIVL